MIVKTCTVTPMYKYLIFSDKTPQILTNQQSWKEWHQPTKTGRKNQENFNGRMIQIIQIHIQIDAIQSYNYYNDMYNDNIILNNIPQ